MKIVREHINEKFTEEGDPIHDLGIGDKFASVKVSDIIKRKKDFFSDRISDSSFFELSLRIKQKPNSSSVNKGVIVKAKHNHEDNKLTLHIIFCPEPVIIRRDILDGSYVYKDSQTQFAVIYGTEKYEDWADYFEIIK